VIVLGLTGGVGSGKSTVGRLLAERGAVVIDADLVAREVMAPGMQAHDAVAERFGPEAVTADGTIDRPALAALVFADPTARRDLNAIVHPVVGEEILAQVEGVGAAQPDAIVVLEVPLLAEVGRDRYPVAGVLVVDVPVELAVTRLVSGRGFSEEEAWARIAAQATRDERLATADEVIDNSGDLDHLRSEVDRAWAWILALA